MNSILRIFIAGSKALVNQRDIARAEITKVNNLMLHDNIRFEPHSYEDFINAQLGDSGQQNNYFSFIKNEADIFILLTKGGNIRDISKKELNVAYQNFLEKRHPAIFVYDEIGHNENDINKNELIKIVPELIKIVPDYYIDYDSEDGLRLKIQTSLKMYIKTLHEVDSPFHPIERYNLMNFNILKKVYVDNIISVSQAKNDYIDLSADFMSLYDPVLDTVFIDKDEENDDYIIDGDDIFYDNDGTTMEYPANETINVSTALDSYKRLVILGKPGSGKTTSLKKILTNKCEAFINGSEKRIPIYVKLSLLSREVTIIDFLNKKLKADWIGRFLNDNIILLLDGVNEISLSESKYVISDIDLFLNQHPNIPAIITSRKHGFQNFRSFPVFEIRNLSPNDIKAYLEKRIGKANINKLLLDTRLQEDLATNPMNLNLIIKTWIHWHSIPSNRGELYNYFIDFTTKRENEKRNRQIAHPLLKNILSQIAFRMKEKGVVSLSVQEVIYILNDCRINMGIILDPILLLDELLKDGLLIKDIMTNISEPLISFVHETYLEFFTAYYISLTYNKKRELPTKLYEPEWYEVLKMTLDLIFPKINDKEKVQLLDQFRLEYAQNFNDFNIIKLYEILLPQIERSKTVKNYLEQFMLSIMYNIKNANNNLLEEESKCQDLFTAIAILSSSTIFDIILYDTFWRRVWTKNLQARDTLAKHSSNVFLLYSKVEMINDSNIYISTNEEKAFGILEKLLLYRLSDNELNILYSKTHYAPYLCLSNDVDFIDKHKKEFIEAFNKCEKTAIHNMINPIYFNYVFSNIYGNLEECVQLKLLAVALNCFPNFPLLRRYLFNIVDYKKIEYFISCLKPRILIETPPTLVEWFEQLNVPISVNNKHNTIAKSKENIKTLLSQQPSYYCRAEIIKIKDFPKAISLLPNIELIVKRFGLYRYFPQYINKRSKVYVRSLLYPNIFYSRKGKCHIRKELIYTADTQDENILYAKVKKGIFALECSDESKKACGFMEGIVTTCNQGFCHIYALESKCDFFAPNSECYEILSVGDKVSFFPTFNYVNSEFKHMAVCVQRIGSFRKEGCIINKRNSSISNSYVYNIIDNIDHSIVGHAFDTRDFNIGDNCTYIIDVYKSKERFKILY